MSAHRADLIFSALDSFRIELPSWGFANTGTRFGKFMQAAAATTLEEKFSDAAQVHALTGACPTLALHVRWDLPAGVESTAQVATLAQRFGIAAGSPGAPGRRRIHLVQILQHCLRRGSKAVQVETI